MTKTRPDWISSVLKLFIKQANNKKNQQYADVCNITDRALMTTVRGDGGREELPQKGGLKWPNWAQV